MSGDAVLKIVRSTSPVWVAVASGVIVSGVAVSVAAAVVGLAGGSGVLLAAGRGVLEATGRGVLVGGVICSTGASFGADAADPMVAQTPTTISVNTTRSLVHIGTSFRARAYHLPACEDGFLGRTSLPHGVLCAR